jgi:hypothetical protein
VSIEPEYAKELIDDAIERAEEKATVAEKEERSKDREPPIFARGLWRIRSHGSFGSTLPFT